MPELPNLLRQRLAETHNGASREHPDADTITAYVEQSLPATERQTVVTHLSVCEPCREVVTLSQPQLPELAIQTVIKPAAVSGWRRLFTPSFGLAASVAAMAIIAVLVLQLPHRTAQPTAQSTQQAKVTAPNVTAPGDQASPAETTEPLAAPPSDTRSASAVAMDLAVPAKEALVQTKREESVRARTAAGFTAPAPPPPPAKAPVLTAGLQKKDYVNTNFFAANSEDKVVLDGQSDGDFPSAPQPRSAPTNRVFIADSGKLTNFSDIPAANAAGQSNVRILTPQPPAERFGCTFPLCKIVEKGARSVLRRTPGTIPAIRSNTLTFSTMGGQGKFSDDLQKSGPAEVAAAPEKPEAGGLERSDAFSPGAISASRSRLLESAPTLWKVAGGKLIKSVGQSQWEDAYPAASGSFEFSCVSARSADVWAGGSHASLIHSRDGGLTWESVKLGDATGTIVNIIAGGLSVQVKTSDNQIWSSPDGGKTWTMVSE
jgi:hypothetical protein